MKPVLSLTLSTQRAQVALVLPGKTEGDDLQSFFRENSEARRHSEWLLPEIADLLKNSELGFKDLEGIAVDIGPGSFTGLRVGFQTAQALSYAHGLPCFTASSLEILSYGFSPEIRVFALINAFRNLVYFGDSKVPMGTRQAIEVLSFEEAAHRINSAGPAFLVGDAYSKLDELRRLLAPSEKHLSFQTERDFPSAVTLAEMALAAAVSRKSLWTKDWNSISPLYLRGSEAEEKARLK